MHRITQQATRTAVGLRDADDLMGRESIALQQDAAAQFRMKLPRAMADVCSCKRQRQRYRTAHAVQDGLAFFRPEDSPGRKKARFFEKPNPRRTLPRRLPSA
jgi:hypothetical protein